MTKIFFILILLCYADIVSAENNDLNKTFQHLTHAKEDTIKVNLLSDLTEIYFNNSKLDSALLLANQGLELSKSIGYKKGEIYFIKFLADQSWTLGDFSTSVKFGYLLQEFARSAKDSSLLFYSYVVLINSYRDQGDYREALRLNFYPEYVKLNFRNRDKSAIYFAVIASNYYGLEKFDSASYYLNKSLSYPKDDFYGWIMLINGRTEAKLMKVDKAFDCYRESMRALLQENNIKDLAGAYNSIATLFESVSQTDSTIFYGKKALELSMQKSFNKELLEAYIILSKVYEKINTADALHYYKLAMEEKNNLFNSEKQRQITSYKFNEILKQNEIKSAAQQYKSRNRIHVLIGLLGFFLVSMIFLFRNIRLKQKAKQNIEKAYNQLKSTQSQLIQSEKMASLGELTAGIAHEIQNPLNFVNNFSEVSNELIDEMNEELDKGDIVEAKAIASDIKQNLEKINHHGKRADSIVKGMLQHSRNSTGQKEPTNINALADEYLRLAYHGLRAKDKSFNATLKTDFDETIGKINIIPQDIGRAILNLITNAFYAVNEKKQQLAKDLSGFETLTGLNGYEPTVSISTKKTNNKVAISVKDNGNGIPQKVLDKIFQPFFTTKPTGDGTGLGLSMSYDIVKAHGGELKVETKENEGSDFIIQLNNY